MNHAHALFAALIFSFVVLSACAPSNPPLQSVPKANPAPTPWPSATPWPKATPWPVEPTELDPAGKPISSRPMPQIPFVRKVDVLFVIDTSDSMIKHQENLKTNIDRFVDAFKANRDVDFHIGVVSIWDSIRYNDEKVIAIKKPYPIGLLRPLKDPAKPGEALPGPQFVTRGPRFSEVLGETLKLGIEPRAKWVKKGKGKVEIDLGGPEWEEVFSPVVPALGEQNPEFYRKDAHLAVVFITDADDSSPNWTADSLARKLFELKGGQAHMASAHAALALDNCKPDYGRVVRNKGKIIRILPPTNILDFVTLMSGRSMNLCDQKGQPNFGKRLGEIGRAIERKASTLMYIPLDQVPDIETLVVTYVVGDKSFPLPGGAGFTFDEQDNIIQIHGDHPVIVENPGGEIKIDFTPINWKRLKKDHVKRFGEN